MADGNVGIALANYSRLSKLMRASVRNRSGYSLLREEQEEQLQHDARFDIPPEEVPYGAIALALFLMAFGLAALVLAWMHFTQVIFGKEQAEIGFTVVGLITLVPGAYHSWIAFCVWRGVPGYRWSDIPS
ncbi:hypothetical protein OEZ86_011359 [Tetradesmus obliquus]|nr:hypothetical protein OEZ86_011359 [Tetradesmus obliquus]